jgi:hypothetical protein
MATYSTYDLGVKIANAASAAGQNPSIAVEQLRQESVNFNPYYIYGPGKSPTGAMGLAQFEPGTWAQYGNGGNPYNPDDAIPAYIRYMSHLLSIFNGRIDIALAAYNSGENRQEYRNAAAQGRAINWSVLPAGVQSQTQNYVNTILSKAQSSPAPAPAPQTGSGAGDSGGSVPASSGDWTPDPNTLSSGDDGGSSPVMLNPNAVYAPPGGDASAGLLLGAVILFGLYIFFWE